ncbi:anti-sigma factor [Tabrizicola sp.]|uniref:anti-sigma factor family protein n=1 Tax=Tabrizicola sp. TaxID=2005166 RepID=UPI00286C2DB9|nr:anti-sigma factor [Tabrizicola sp.]
MNEPISLSCPDWAIRLHSLADDALDPETTLAMERHIDGCDACRTALTEIQTMKRRIKQDEVRWAAPDALRTSIASAVALEHSQAVKVAPQPTGVSGPTLLTRVWQLVGRWGAAPSMAALGFAIILTFNPVRDGGLQQEVLASHIRSMLANHLVDLQTSDQHTVRPWFNGKVDFSPPVVDLADQGFPLVGGRVDYLGGRVVAALVYRRNDHIVNLFVWPNHGPVQPLRTSTLDGYSFARWSAGGLLFWSVSDASATDMSAFHKLYSARTGF